SGQSAWEASEFANAAFELHFSSRHHIGSESGEILMQVQLHCAACDSRFTPEAAERGTMWAQIQAEGPWSGLGDGATSEGHLSVTLRDRGGIHCPCCGARIELTEDDLARLSLQLLEQW